MQLTEDHGEQADVSSADGRLEESDVLCLLLAFTIRHGLSKVALGDLLDLLRVLGVTEAVPLSKYKLLKHVVEDISAQNVTHFYCSSCSAYVPPNSVSCDVCETAFSRAAALKDGHFFVYLPIKDQLKDLLESGYISQNMADETPNIGYVGNDLNGTRYRRNPAPETLTLNWNFDGLPIFKSSGASPVANTGADK